MLEMHLRQAGYIYSASGPLTKHKESVQNFKETWGARYIY